MKKFIFLCLLLGLNSYLVYTFATNSIDIFLYQMEHLPKTPVQLATMSTFSMNFISFTTQQLLVFGSLALICFYFLFLMRFWALIGIVLSVAWTAIFLYIKIPFPPNYEYIALFAVHGLVVLGINLLSRRSKNQQKWLVSIEADLKSKKWHQIKEEYMISQINEAHQKIALNLKELKAKPSYKKIKLLRNQLNEALNYPEKIFEKRVDGVLSQRSLTAHRYYENFYEEHQQWIRHYIQSEKAYFKGKKEADMTYQDKTRLESVLHYLSHDLVNMHHKYQLIRAALEKAGLQNNLTLKQLFEKFRRQESVESLENLVQIYQEIEKNHLFIENLK